MRLDAEYYINKTLIPPLERIFNLVGANVRSWYEDMPRAQREYLRFREKNRGGNTTTIHSFMRSRLCSVCGMEETDEGMLFQYPFDKEMCRGCQNKPTYSAFVISSQLERLERRHWQLQNICADCCGVPLGEEICCDSRDCPAFYSRLKAESRLHDHLTRPSHLLQGML